MSKPGSKKRANKAKKKKAKSPARRQHRAAAAAASDETLGGEPKGLHPSRMWTLEAKREAVALLERGDAQLEEIAAELGVSGRSLQNWRAEFEKEERDTPMTPDERRQFTRLRKENERLRMECEILKKAATFFARHRS